MRKNYFIIISIGIIVFGFLAGIYIYKINYIEDLKIAKEKIEDECTEISQLYRAGLLDTITANGEEKKISPNAVLIMNKHYIKCNHTISENIEIPKEAVNLTQVQFEDLYKEWKLIGFSNNEIVIQKDIEGICDEHYVIKEKDGYIAIYTLDEDENEKFNRLTNISIEYLTQTDLINIKKGIRAVGREELNSILEDFE